MCLFLFQYHIALILTALYYIKWCFPLNIEISGYGVTIFSLCRRDPKRSQKVLPLLYLCPQSSEMPPITRELKKLWQPALILLVYFCLLPLAVINQYVPVYFDASSSGIFLKFYNKEASIFSLFEIEN